MTGVTLDGVFTIEGSENSRQRKESYQIESVSKISGDLWMIQARIQYGERDVTLPVPVHIKWAGDTPILSLTDVGLPGLGTFSARIIFYRGQYAGIWSGGDHGGHQFGKIVRRDASQPNEAQADEAESNEDQPDGQ